MIIIVGVIALLFVGLYFANQYKTKTAIEKSGNPYGKDNLHQATVDQLDDPLYQNQITPTDLAASLEEKEGVTVYFYDPLCKWCLETTPVLVPVAEDNDVDVKKLNLREFPAEKQKYNIEGTPTLVHYVDGEEVGRLSGSAEDKVFERFFENYVLNEE